MQNKIAEFISSEIKDGKRLIKVRVMGMDDIQELLQIAPHGIDSCPPPIKTKRALHHETLDRGTNVISGYVNDDQEAEPGETRLYSTDENGELQIFIWIHADGTIEMGGDQDNLVRYAPLSAELSDFKTQVQQQLALISSAIASLGGAYTPGVLTMDISDSKIDEIKTL